MTVYQNFPLFLRKRKGLEFLPRRERGTPGFGRRNHATMRFVLITGPDGAGKTYALHSFQDADYYAVDNLPPALLPALAAHCREEGRRRVAVVADTRSGPAFAELPAVLRDLEQTGIPVEVLFLDAGNETIVQRYKETRRPHPLLAEENDLPPDSGLLAAIEAERALLQNVRALADRTLDTTGMTVAQLRDAILAAYGAETRTSMQVTITSFGFKYGLPIDSDLVFDVRFLNNPHYVPALKPYNGTDAEVKKFVYDDPRTQPFQTLLSDLVAWTLPEYQREGKSYLNIAIGCTGGKHRSVVLTEDLAERLRADDWTVVVRHRDIEQGKREEPDVGVRVSGGGDRAEAIQNPKSKIQNENVQKGDAL